MKSVEELVNFLEGKDIAIVGNALSLFNRVNTEIDKHEIVIRINKGSPRRNEKHLGSKTDILAISMNLSEDYILRAFNPKFVMYMTPLNRHALGSYLQQNAIFYPLENWKVLQKELEGNRPSTGCMIVDFLFNYVDYKNLTLYGFDFMATPTWYTESSWEGQHDYLKEKDYIIKIVGEENIR